MITIVEGWTEPIEYILKADGSAIDLTGKTVTILIWDARNRAQSLSGILEVIDATAGKVSYAPSGGDLTFQGSPYKVRFKVMPDGYFAPNSTAEMWQVLKP